jgi:hypothetical protein
MKVIVIQASDGGEVVDVVRVRGTPKATFEQWFLDSELEGDIRFFEWVEVKVEG